MENAVRPGIALSAVAAGAIGSAIAVTPAIAVPNHIPTLTTMDSQNILLTGFIADIYNQIQPVVAGVVDSTTAVIGAIPFVGPPVANQIDILYTYGQQAIGSTVLWADDLVTPFFTGQFWPVSGLPGNYLTGAINSTVNWGQSLINTAIGFVGAEISYFTGWLPNFPNVIANIFNQITNTIQQVINWITGFIPRPFAAVSPAAAAAVTAPRAAVANRVAVRPAAAQSRGASRAAAAAPATKATRSAAARAVAKSAR